MYQNPAASMYVVEGQSLEYSEEDLQQHFDDFYEDVYAELNNFGSIEDLHICDNLGDHLVGNVYVKFERDDDAQKALENLNGRYYAGKLLSCEFSPVTDFREARCRQFDMGECTRGGYCNFMHLKRPSPDLERSLFPRRNRTRKRSRSPPRRDRHKELHYRDRHYRDDDRHYKRRSRSKSKDRKRRSRHRSKSRSRDRSSRDRKHKSRRKSKDRKSSRSPRKRSRSRSPKKEEKARDARSSSRSPKRRKIDSQEESQTNTENVENASASSASEENKADVDANASN